MKPRPGFPLAPKQNILGPLILDREESVKVPAAINTYLREYQRDGVKFFWRQYKEGRGGLLGDDMGLVSLEYFHLFGSIHPQFTLINRVSGDLDIGFFMS